MSKPNTKKRLLMLDSGAFSIWNRGTEIDLEKYLDFCEANPQVSYYVGLDVIPGKPNVPSSLSEPAVWDCCERGFNNWVRMVKRLGDVDKTIPVFHMNDNPYWLQKYLDHGATYIGISPANDRHTKEKLFWLSSILKYLFDRNHKPTIKTHGFAVTSYPMMNAMQWHSVDSASWIRSASFGSVYVPRTRGGVYDYTRKPYLVNFSPKSPTRINSSHQRSDWHYTRASGRIKAQIDEYLQHAGLKLGKYKKVKVSGDHKLTSKQIWLDKKARIIADPVELGLVSCYRERGEANVDFLVEAENHLPVDHIYFAGSGQGSLEEKMRTRLVSYLEGTTRLFKEQSDLVREAL